MQVRKFHSLRGYQNEAKMYTPGKVYKTHTNNKICMHTKASNCLFFCR